MNWLLVRNEQMNAHTHTHTHIYQTHVLSVSTHEFTPHMNAHKHTHTHTNTHTHTLHVTDGIGGSRLIVLFSPVTCLHVRLPW